MGSKESESRKEQRIQNNAQAILSDYYVGMERNKANRVLIFGHTMRISRMETPLRSNINGMAQREDGPYDKPRNDLAESITTNVLSLVENQGTKIDIRKSALLSAREFWERTLQADDKSYDLIVLARLRIEEISVAIGQLDEHINLKLFNVDYRNLLVPTFE